MEGDLLTELEKGSDAIQNQVILNTKARKGLMDLRDRVEKKCADQAKMMNEKLEHLELL